MSEDLLFGKIAEPEMTVVNFDDHFRDRIGEVQRGHIEVFPKLWNLRPYDKTNGEITRVPRLTTAYHKMREETKDWGDYEKLPEEIPEFPLIRRMLLGAVSVVQTPRLRAFETMKGGQRNSRKSGSVFCAQECRSVTVYVDRKNPCKRIPIKMRKKTTRHRQEEYPAWISISSVTLKTTRIRWKKLHQQTKVLRHWSLRPLL